MCIRTVLLSWYLDKQRVRFEKDQDRARMAGGFIGGATGRVLTQVVTMDSSSSGSSSSGGSRGF
jgi:hypothetical protein